jgi:hypothetical protein
MRCLHRELSEGRPSQECAAAVLGQVARWPQETWESAGAVGLLTPAVAKHARDRVIPSTCEPQLHPPLPGRA